MSYQLVFWKQPQGKPADATRIYERLMGNEPVDGLSDLPGELFVTRVAETFSHGWERLDDYNWERSDGSFQVTVGSQHILVVTYNLPGDILNEFIDIAAEFECKLYDPQTGVRFDG